MIPEKPGIWIGVMKGIDRNMKIKKVPWPLSILSMSKRGTLESSVNPSKNRIVLLNAELINIEKNNCFSSIET
jgi:hypothetical protein